MNPYPRLAALVLFVATSLLLTPNAYAQTTPVAGEEDLLPTPSTKKDLYPVDADAAKA